MFEKLEDEHAEEIRSWFENTAAIQMHIILDLDNDTAFFHYNTLCCRGSFPSDFSVSISEGLCCLEETIDEAASEDEYLAAVIESKMEKKLKESATLIEPQAPQIGL